MFANRITSTEYKGGLHDFEYIEKYNECLIFGWTNNEYLIFGWTKYWSGKSPSWKPCAAYLVIPLTGNQAMLTIVNSEETGQPRWKR